MISEDLMRKWQHIMLMREALAIETAIQRLLDAGTPFSDITLCRNYYSQSWWLHVVTPEEKWLDWLSNNH